MKKILFMLCFLACFTSFSQKQFQNEVSSSLAYTSDKVMQLAEAFSEDQYDWSPSEGVRSVRGVLTHVISANYFFGSKMGATVPSSINMQTLEQDLGEKSKKELTEALKDSYSYITDAIKNASDDKLSGKVEFPFPGEFTGMTAALIGLSHTNEHLGQLIAYARSNDITPPWSEGQEE